MSARDDHANRAMAGADERECWRALFDEIDQLRALNTRIACALESILDSPGCPECDLGYYVDERDVAEAHAALDARLGVQR